MTWQLQFLWTDIFIWLLVAMLLILSLYMVRKPHLRAPWRSVFNRPIALASIIILSTFVLIGLLDSIHFTRQSKSSDELISLVDVLLEPAKTQSESTYSAPFSIHGFTKEAHVIDGAVQREYPRLKFGGRHLKDVTEKSNDIWSRFIKTTIQALIVWLSLCIAVSAYVCIKNSQSFKFFWCQVLTRKKEFPWGTFLTMFGLMFWLGMLVHSFMPYYHIFGTSKVGEDVFYQSIKSIRTGLIMGTLTTLFMLPFAVLLGIMAGYFRGVVDDVIQYLYTTLSSIPGVLLIASAVLTLQVVMNQNEHLFQTQLERADARLLALCVILGLTSWTGLCRLLRAETLKIREIEFIQAARALGVKHFKIILSHLLPNVMHLILISVALDFSGLVLAEAVLSYVGVGVDPTSYSWGTMINSARLEMARVPIVWWSLSSAFLMMFLLVLSANIFSDALRDAFDPRV